MISLNFSLVAVKTLHVVEDLLSVPLCLVAGLRTESTDALTGSQRGHCRWTMRKNPLLHYFGLWLHSGCG